MTKFEVKQYIARDLEEAKNNITSSGAAATKGGHIFIAHFKVEKTGANYKDINLRLKGNNIEFVSSASED